MDRTERFYRIDRLLHERGVVPLRTFLDELSVSRATFKRDLEYLRDRLHAPIAWDGAAGGYRFDGEGGDGFPYELPGLWLSEGELYALLASETLLSEIGPGILAGCLGPVRERLSGLLGGGGHGAEEVARRIRILSVARRPVDPAVFGAVAKGLLDRKRLRLDAWSRSRDEVNRRTVSPQRLLHYRDNWYLAAFCHWRKGLRSFSLDTVREAESTAEPAVEVGEKALESHLASAYGIFGGKVKGWASLRFSPERARWVEAERWHRDQEGERLPDGGYRLRVPYADERELVQDILRHGRHVVVESPPPLRARVREEAGNIFSNHSG